MFAFSETNVVRDNQFPFHVFLSDAKFGFPHHWHDEIEMIYAIAGTVKLGINDEFYTLEKGDLVLIGSREIHYFLPSDGGTFAVFQFKLSIFENFYSNPEERSLILPVFENCYRINNSWSSELRQKVDDQIRSMMQEDKEKQSGYKLALKARLYDLVVLLLRNLPMEHKNASTSVIKGEKLFEKTFKYVEDNYNEDIDLDTIAKIEGFSVYHFSRKFKEYTGMTFIEYLNQYRITRAVWFMFNDQDYTITEVAMKTGFNSVKSFNRVFKKVKGESPSQYKKAKYEQF